MIRRGVALAAISSLVWTACGSDSGKKNTVPGDAGPDAPANGSGGTGGVDAGAGGAGGGTGGSGGSGGGGGAGPDGGGAGRDGSSGSGPDGGADSGPIVDAAPSDGGPDAMSGAFPVVPSDSYKRVAAVELTSIVIGGDSHLYGFGTNGNGRLGQGEQSVVNLTTGAQSLTPTPLVGAGATKSFVHVVSGRYHFLALDDTGDLYGWGGNTDAQVDDSGSDVLEPTLVMSDVVAMDAFANRSVALDSMGRLWFWGRDVGGVPVEYTNLPAGVELASVVRGENHVLALTTDGHVYGWGNNGQGQLGNDRPSSTVADPTLLLGADGSTPLSRIVAIDAGLYFSVALDADGVIWAFGDNSRGTLGDGTGADQYLPVAVDVSGSPSPAPFVSVSADFQQVFAIDENGRGWAWGNDDQEQLGAVGADCGDLCALAPVPLDGVDTIAFTDIVPGYSHGLARDTDGNFWGWGVNTTGAVGDGTRLAAGNPRVAPVRVNGFLGRTVLDLFAEHSGDSPRTTFFLDDDSVWTFGRHGNISGTFTEGISPALVTGLVGTQVVDYCTGSRFSAALDSAGTVYTIGEYVPALGRGDTATATTNWETVPFSVASTQIREIECGSTTVYAIDDSDGLWSWGAGSAGQLGQSVGDTTGLTVSDPTRVAGLEGTGTLDNVLTVAASVNSPGREQATVILKNGQVATWGAQLSGSLGRTALHSCTAAAFACNQIPRLVCAPGTANLDTCDDGSGPTFLSGATLLASPTENNLVLAGGVLYAWGSDAKGLNGQGTYNASLSVPTAVTGITGTPIVLGGGDTFRAVLTDQGDVWTWGTNNYGQLGRGYNDDQTCGTSSCAQSPEKVAALDDVNIVDIALGKDHTAALDDAGRVWTWGSNGDGQLGNEPRDALGGGHYGALTPRVVTLIPD